MVTRSCIELQYAFVVNGDHRISKIKKLTIIAHNMVRTNEHQYVRVQYIVCWIVSNSTFKSFLCTLSSNSFSDVNDFHYNLMHCTFIQLGALYFVLFPLTIAFILWSHSKQHNGTEAIGNGLWMIKLANFRNNLKYIYSKTEHDCHCIGHSGMYGID